ncbi:MAG: MarR family transcriptional regulator [Candidatus Dormiibacterota bacterium]
MVRIPNSDQAGPSSAVDSADRGGLIARLVQLQPSFQRRFDADMPTQVRELRASLQDMVANTTVRQLEVLRLLAENGPVAMHTLASLHGISRSSTTEVVDRLVGHGLAERHHDPLNRRVVEVALTVRAKELLARFRRLQQASITALADVYSDDELATLVRLLEKLTKKKTLLDGPCDFASDTESSTEGRLAFDTVGRPTRP